MQTCFASIFSEIAQVADSRLSMKTASSLKSRSSQWSQGLAVLCPCPRKMLAEGIGSFILVFAGTGAVMVNQLSNGAVTHLGVSFVFGAVVAALIYSLGHISGAHFNPAVTLAFWTSGFFPKQDILPYILAQCSGAVVASFLLLLSLGRVGNLGATLPLNQNWLQALVLETVLTFILMFVIFGSGLDRRAPIGFAGLAIGLTVGLEAACMGPITGAINLATIVNASANAQNSLSAR